MNPTPSADTRPQVRYWVPEGYVTEEGLRADVATLARRGFGAIELVAINLFSTKVPDDCRWGTPRYYEAARVLLHEAAAHGLAVDIANGPGWPISAPQIADADDPATLYELTYGKALTNFSHNEPLELPERRVTHDEGTPKLVAVSAYRYIDGHSELLNHKTYVDLMPYVHDGIIDWRPAEEDCSWWHIFAFWGQPACHKVLDRHFVIDHLSRTGAEASIAWWEHELLPALGDEARHLRSFFCDSLEYRVAMEWTRDFAEVFEERHGYSILPYLPAVGEPATYPQNDVPGYEFTEPGLTESLQHDYLETLSWMYRERHLHTLCDAAARLGKTVRYQVAYNKPLCEEDAAAAVDLPENESLGRQSLDNLRVMAGAVHLTRKPRYSLEAAAEFGYAFGQTQRDLLWWLKRAAIVGCNAQVLHGASYCGAGMRGVPWIGWSAWHRDCSNNWNRTLSERSFAQMSEAIARLNTLRRKRALVDVAFVREAYLNHGHGADGDHVVHDDGLLCAHGYSYEFLSPGLLAHRNARVENGRLDPDGAAYKALVLAEQPYLETATLLRLAELARAGLPIFVVRIWFWPSPNLLASAAKRDEWRAAYAALLSCAQATEVNDYESLLAAFEEAGITPDARYEADHVFPAHVQRAGEDVYLLYNGNCVKTGRNGKAAPDTFMPDALRSGVLEPIELQASLAGEGQPFLLDFVSGQEYALAGAQRDGRVDVRLPLEADQLVAVGLREDTSDLPPWSWDGLGERALGGWSLTLHELQESPDVRDHLASGYRMLKDFGCFDELPWWDHLSGVATDFAGYGEYRTTVDLGATPAQAYLQLPEWNDALELEVNGQTLPVVAGFSDRVDVRHTLRAGANELVIRVYSNLSNRLDVLSEKIYRMPKQHYGLHGSIRLLMAE